MNLVLIGYRGTGKSVVAEVVSRKLGMAAVSLDEEIVREAQARFPLDERIRQNVEVLRRGIGGAVPE